MPVIMFNNEDTIVLFDNTFVADQHEGWFNLNIWTRVKVDRENPTVQKYDRRGDAYLAKFKDATIPSFVVKDL